MKTSARTSINSLTLCTAIMIGSPLAFAHDAADPHAQHRRMMMLEGTTRSTADYTPPAVSLLRQDGTRISLPDELNDGRAVVLNFIFTTCTTICPVTSKVFSQLQSKLGSYRNKVHLVSISIDPEHDTPKVLADYARRLGADPARWKFLTGDPKAVADVASSFGVVYYPENGQVVHAQAAAVVDPAGRLAAIYYGQMWDPEILLRDLEKARKG